MSRDDIGWGTDQFPPAGGKYQLGDSIAREHCRLKIRSALETMGCVGVQRVSSCHLANCCRIPPRRFDQDVARFLCDHRIEAAHGAGEAAGLLRIRNYEIVGGEFAVDTVE